jgi:hypothetical protein
MSERFGSTREAAKSADHPGIFRAGDSGPASRARFG